MASDKQKRGNWIKASLSLLYLKEGISEKLNAQALQFHTHIKQRVAASCKTAVTSTRCTYCTSKSVKRSKKLTNAGTFWYINCKSNVCNQWLDTLIQFHEHMPGPNVEWANCDPTLWASQPWEIAKVFQPIGYKQRTNAEESDVAGLLTLMLDCKFFHSIVSNKKILREIKDCRNKIMHSATLEVEETDMKDWLDLMIALLEDKIHLGQLPSCKLAADRIRELRDKSIEVSFDNEHENTALSLQIAALSDEVSNIQRTSDEMRCSVGDLTSKQHISSEDSEHIHKELSTTAATVFQNHFRYHGKQSLYGMEIFEQLRKGPICDISKSTLANFNPLDSEEILHVCGQPFYCWPSRFPLRLCDDRKIIILHEDYFEIRKRKEYVGYLYYARSVVPLMATLQLLWLQTSH